MNLRLLHIFAATVALGAICQSALAGFTSSGGIGDGKTAGVENTNTLLPFPQPKIALSGVLRNFRRI